MVLFSVNNLFSFLGVDLHQTTNRGVQPQPYPNQWNGGGAYCSYGQGYEAYGYAPPT